MKCIKCGEEVPAGVQICPSCGNPVAYAPEPKKLEEPLSPLEAGAVPMVPIAPPPRTTRIAPRNPRPYVPHTDRPAAKVKNEIYHHTLSASEAYARRQDEAVPQQGDVFGIESTAQMPPLKVSKKQPSMTGVISHIKKFTSQKWLAIGACCIVAVILVVVVVRASISWFGPFSAGNAIDYPSWSAAPADTSDTSASVASDTGELQVHDKVADYSWAELEQIAKLIEASESDDAALDVARQYHLCNEKGKLDGTQTKDVELSNNETVTMRIAGFLQDEKSDGSGRAGITFIASTSVGVKPMNASAQTQGGWEQSTLRDYLSDDLLSELPSELSDAIVDVDKQTNAPINDGTKKQTTTRDALWVPAYSEVVGPLSSNNRRFSIYKSEGDQYQLFSDVHINWTEPNKLLALGKNYWWLRSPDQTNGAWFMCVTPDGVPTYGHRPATENAVLFGFCL